MNVHRLETSLTENGKLSLQNLPFKKGDEVEIIILDRGLSKTTSNSHSLRGFHNDPANQIIVATAKVYDCLLLTADSKILNYAGVKTWK